MKRTKLLLLLMVTIWITGCPGFYLYSSPKVYIYNQSDQDMRVLANFDYPDTSVDQSEIITSRMSPDPKRPRNALERNTWRRRTKESGKVTLFFISEALLDEYGEEEAKKRFKPTEKLILSLEDLEKANWKIYFPYELNKTFKAVPHP